MSHHQNDGQNYNKNIVNKFFENVEEFKYLGMIVANQEYIHQGIKSRLNSGDSVQKVSYFLISYLKA
jgi:hypothetical protein